MGAQPAKSDDLFDKLRRFLDARSDVDVEVRVVDGRYTVQISQSGDSPITGR
jgi:hypothetical protein